MAARPVKEGDLLWEPSKEFLQSSNMSRYMGWVNQEFGKTIIMVTHDPSMAEFADRIIVVENGEITEDGSAADILNDYKYILNHNKGDN